jgi:hypothetical protein
MSALVAVVLSAAVALASVAPASADSGECRYKGRKFPQGVAVCQGGLVQLCMNREWQDQGRFCSAPDGSRLGKPFLGPGQVDIPTEPQLPPRLPVRPKAPPPEPEPLPPPDAPAAPGQSGAPAP